MNLGSPPLKILYLHQYFNTPDMSGGTRSYEMARRLVAMGHEVHVITAWRKETDEKSWFKAGVDGIRVHWLPIPYSNELSYRERISAFFKFAYSAAKKSASIKADVVFATSTPLTIALPAVFASRRQRIPMVFEVRDLWPEVPIVMGALSSPLSKYLAKKLEAFAYNNSESIVALSPGMKEGIVNSGYSASKVAVIPNSCDLDFFSSCDDEGKAFRAARSWLKDRPLLLYTGTLGALNGVGCLVSIAKELQRIAPDVRILIIGGGYEFEDIRSRAVAAGVFEVNFFMEGRIPKRDMPAAVNAASMVSSFVIDKTALHANSANKFFDALAAGKPILINYGSWQRALIETNKNGLVIWKMPAEMAANLIAEKIQSSKWINEAGRRSRALGERFFSRDVLASQLERVIVGAVTKSEPEPASIAPGDYGI